MVSSLLAIMIKGLILTGGFSEMWAAAEAGGRLDFNFSGNPFERHTFWNLLFGSLILWGSPYATSQFLIHRCLCLRTPREGKISLYVNFCGQILLLVVVSTIGLTLYTFYQVKGIPYENFQNA
jgi:sodium-coupled monocarboxylate transporter 8/12